MAWPLTCCLPLCAQNKAEGNVKSAVGSAQQKVRSPQSLTAHKSGHALLNSGLCTCSLKHPMLSLPILLQVGEVFGSDSQQVKGKERETRGDAQHDAAQAKVRR